MDPLLIEVPERMDTERLILRCPQPGDGAALNPVVFEALASLRPVMPWAQVAQTLAQSEAFCRRQQARFRLREELALFIFERDAAGGEGPLLGATGLHRPDWALGRFEIGYWCAVAAQGRGVVTEAVIAVNRLAFDHLKGRRVEIRMDDDNVRSWRVAERAGFTLEGVLRLDSATPQGEPRSTRVYARVRGVEEP